MSFIKSFTRFKSPSSNEILSPVRGNLGSLISNQMYNGVSSNQSTLLTGEFDDEDSFDVDPACDMSTDRFDVNLDSKAFHQEVPKVDE